MNEFFANTAYFGVFLSLATYWIGLKIQKKCRLAIANPLLISVILTIALLLVLHIDYETFQYGKNFTGAVFFQNLLTPCTVCLAIPLYEKIHHLKAHPAAILGGVFSGVLASACSILALAALFGLTHQQYVTLLPKSITTAMAMGVAEELGGMPVVTVAAVSITGIGGNIMAMAVLKLFRVTEPIAKGVACGTAAHAIGTAKAHEMGELEEAMSGLSIAIAGLMTVATASVFACFY